MTPSRATSLISSEADLITSVGYDGPDPIEDWLGNRCEFADAFDDDGGAESFRRVVFMVGNFESAQYTIELHYPFEFSELEEEADRAEVYFRSVIHASGLDVEDATLGNPGADGDVTEELASELLGNANVDDVVAALGGEWRRIDFDVRHGPAGEDIYAWFVPADDRPIALGIGAVDLFISPLLGSDSEGYRVDEWPDPSVGLWSDGASAWDLIDADGCLRRLRSALATTPGGSTGAGFDGSRLGPLGRESLVALRPFDITDSDG